MGLCTGSASKRPLMTTTTTTCRISFILQFPLSQFWSCQNDDAISTTTTINSCLPTTLSTILQCQMARCKSFFHHGRELDFTKVLAIIVMNLTCKMCMMCTMVFRDISFFNYGCRETNDFFLKNGQTLFNTKQEEQLRKAR